MKLLFVLAILVLIGLSFYADYKWKQWIAARRQARSPGNDHAQDQNRRS